MSRTKPSRAPVSCSGGLAGEVKVFKDGSVLPTPFLTIPPATMRLETARGLLGLAFDPGYATNGRFYTFSIQDEAVAEQQVPGENPGRVVVRHYEVSVGDPDRADPASAVDILSFDNWSFGHNAGWLGFNPKLARSGPVARSRPTAGRAARR